MHLKAILDDYLVVAMFPDRFLVVVKKIVIKSRFSIRSIVGQETIKVRTSLEAAERRFRAKV